MTATEPRLSKGWALFPLMLSAPLVGIRVHWPDVLHAVTMEALPVKTWPDGLATAACGKASVRLLPHSDGGPLPWPPKLKGLPDKYTRCPDPRCSFGR